MRIKICGIRNENDLRAALSASPDAVGFLVGQVHPSPDFILACTARRLARSLPPFVQPWLVTHYSVRKLKYKSFISKTSFSSACLINIF